MNLRKTLVFTVAVALSNCGQPGSEPITPSPKSEQETNVVDSLATEMGFPVGRNGKLIGASHLSDIYELAPLDTFDLPVIDNQFVEALERNLRLLRLQQRPKNQQVGGLRINYWELEEAIRILKSWQQTKPLELHQFMDAYQIWGADRQGNVRFTGYFTPVLQVSKEARGRYQYPIYDRPLEWEGAFPTRAEIEGEGALKGLGLELAYATDKVDIYYMQVQGSGFVEYENGKKELLAYNGTNRHPYRSIEKYIMSRDDIPLSNLSIRGIRNYLRKNPHIADSVLFQNPSYTFFTPKRSAPTGAGSVPLIQDYSIAVDRRYIPLGSCLLAAFPIFDHRKQRVIGHEYRFFVAQDVGGAIKGPGHIDVYCGIGKDAARIAGRINNYGRLWLLLPKPASAQFTSK